MHWPRVARCYISAIDGQKYTIRKSYPRKLYKIIYLKRHRKSMRPERDIVLPFPFQKIFIKMNKEIKSKVISSLNIHFVLKLPKLFDTGKKTEKKVLFCATIWEKHVEKHKCQHTRPILTHTTLFERKVFSTQT